MFTLTSFRLGFRLLAGAIAAAFLTLAPVSAGTISPAQAQVSLSVQFRSALEPHGRWERHARWGEVWIPANRPRDWRPYTLGRWVYTDDWGWYWIEDQSEAAWGLVTYHYGRWVYDDELHWCWIPGEEWGPAWVQWRRGTNVVGWAALPPDEVIVEYQERPQVWVFVRPAEFVAPRIASVVIREREHAVFLRETVVENRTVIIRDRGPRFAVNPGIPAAFIAASVGRPLRAFEVRPRVLPGTAKFRGAVEVRAEDLRRGQALRTQEFVRETQTVVRPADRVQEPRPLAAGEQGRLGDNPPRAAQGQQAPTEGRGVQPKQPPLPGTEGRGRGEPKQMPGTEGRGRGEPKQMPGTEGRGRGEPKQMPGTEGRGRGEPKQMPGTEGRGRGEPKQMPGTEGRGRGEPKQMPGTEGRGGGEPKQMPRTEGRSGGQPKQPAQTEGRGGGAPGGQQQRER
jgi:hypothetical protein